LQCCIMLMPGLHTEEQEFSDRLLMSFKEKAKMVSTGRTNGLLVGKSKNWDLPLGNWRNNLPRHGNAVNER
jgi:hypothetical protein